MNQQIRVRRSGLNAFAIRLGSAFTGLAFVVLVTSRLSPADFGLWSLIGRVIVYCLFVLSILGFWTTRYRARGQMLGKTVLVAAGMFCVVLTAAYLAISFVLSIPNSPAGELYYFLLSAPQISLYVLVLILEAILWGFNPERASLGFGIFEVSKVAFGALLIYNLHDKFAAAILALILAQVAQLLTAVYLNRNEFKDKLQFSLISKMLRTGWLAILNQVHTVVISLDFLLVYLFTASTVPLAIFSAAFVFASVLTYSNSLVSGLYVAILSGSEPRGHTNQIFELQLFFLVPISIGAMILSRKLLHLLNPAYANSMIVLMVLVVAYALVSASMTPETVIAGSDTTDVGANTDFSLYLKSKLFLLAKINISVAAVYLGSVALISAIFHFLGFNLQTTSGASIELGILWAIANLGMGLALLILKLHYSRRIAPISLELNSVAGLFVSSAIFAVFLFVLSSIISIPARGELIQAEYLLLTGLPAIALYITILVAMSKSARNTAKSVFHVIMGSLLKRNASIS